MDLVEVLKNRRTHKHFDGTSIEDSVLLDLVKMAMTAPNHRRNEPWRFKIISSTQIPFFWEKLKSNSNTCLVYPDSDEETISSKLSSLEQRVLKVGAIIYVSCLKNISLAIEQENYAACSASVQNLMLMATNCHLGSFWCTGRLFATDYALEVAGINPIEEIFVGAIWLGTPAAMTEQMQPRPPQYRLEDKIVWWKNNF